MKILSVWGPWAQLIAFGLKDVENRPWSTSYRGPLAIHCTKGGWSNSEAQDILNQCTDWAMITADQASTIYRRLDSDRGKVIAVATVTGCTPAAGHASAWASEGNCIELANAYLVEPFAIRGQQGLRDLASSVELKRVSP